MSVTGLGAAYLDDFRMTGDVVGRANASGASDFADTLKRVAAAGSQPADPQSPVPGPHSPKIDKTDKLYEQCMELEIFLVKNLISSMRSTVQKSGFIDEGFAGKIYEDMLYDEYARDFAKNSSFGLADMAYLELTGQRGRR
jgi:flagellar protein FlgJ